MKKFIKFLFFVIAIIFGAFLIWAVLNKLPGRNVSVQSSSIINTTPLQDLSSIFNDIFKSSEINVLVLGRPGVDYNGGDLADSIIYVHFDPDKNEASLISIPRDLWISDSQEQFKINEVLEKNKVSQVLDEVNKITGIKPDGYIVVDLKMIKNAIDFLGGVDITLEQPAVDWVSGFTLPKGPQHLNGEDAVWLIRNRFNSEGDFFRERHQQEIIKDAFQKFLALSSDKKTEFLKTFIFDPNFLTNAHVDVSKLTPYIFDSKLSNIKLNSIVLDFSTKLIKTENVPIQGQGTTTYISALIPSAGFEDYSQIRDYIKQKLSQ